MALSQTLSDDETDGRQVRVIKHEATKKQQGLRKSARLKAIQSRKQSICESNHVQEIQILPSTLHTKNVLGDRKALQRPPVLHETSKPHQKRKRRHEDSHSSSRDQHPPPSKRPRTSPSSCTTDERATREICDNTTEPIQYWIQTGRWPKKFFEQDSQIGEDLERNSWSEEQMADWNQLVEYVQVGEFRYPLPITKAQIRLHRKASDSSLTGSSEQARKNRNSVYQNSGYDAILARAGSYLRESDELPKNINSLCQELLGRDQAAPQDSLFNDSIFLKTCLKIADRNEARVVQDITRLIVPSAEALATYGAKDLESLIEGVSEGWICSIPVENPQPHPDYSVGFRKSAFTDEQLQKLEPLIGTGTGTGCLSSLFVATYRMFFPFLTCEVKCGDGPLDVADRQNAHSMTLAVRGVVELYKAVKRERELDREILGFSISHDHRSVRIYGHYAIIKNSKTTFYRHPFRTFDFTEQDGREKWTTYKFTKNVYENWMPIQHKRICSAIDQLPDMNFGLSQAATFSQTELSSNFKIPDLPASKMQKTEISHLKNQLANQDKEQKEQMAEIHRLYKEQMTRQDEQMARQDEQMARQDEQIARQDKQIAEQDKRYKEQVDIFKQLLDRH